MSDIAWLLNPERFRRIKDQPADQPAPCDPCSLREHCKTGYACDNYVLYTQNNSGRPRVTGGPVTRENYRLVYEGTDKELASFRRRLSDAKKKLAN